MGEWKVAAAGRIANVILTQIAAPQASARANRAVEFFMRLGKTAECDLGLVSAGVLADDQFETGRVYGLLRGES
ncbi:MULTISPECIES: hypothetical protein [Rugamonas]|uniref:hypothetical protein n=1 Tax=Rugamonas TaxID=212744 RepID=UPI0011145386|nr:MULTISPECIES: hypothetical protein [Rugamonas]WGG51585.1 hypothetical protein QC826_04835 [Rugamonas sp. DEMB1]